MARNVEIKAQLHSFETTLTRARQVAGGEPELIQQDDTYFNTSQGRLKLRAFADGRGELIYYERPDATGPKTSFYVRSPITSPDSLRKALTLAHGQIGRVRKQRHLLLAGRTRIHLDRVQGLGDYLELEVVLAEGDAAQDGIDEAHAVMALLGLSAEQLVAGAYLDLLASSAAP